MTFLLTQSGRTHTYGHNNAQKGSFLCREIYADGSGDDNYRAA
ncbi:hypothetical protein QFZ51_002352 [Chitinophaga sp. W3I9]